MPDTLEQVFSFSVERPQSVPYVKIHIWGEFEKQRGRINPQEVLVIMDGKPFSIRTEDEYDQWARSLEQYFKQQEGKKIVTISVFV